MKKSALRTDVYYNKQGNTYLVENNYNKSLPKIDRVLKYAEEIGLTLPEKKDIKVEVLRGERYKHMLSVEFNSITKPTEGMLLEQDSPIWSWLVY